jgi:hypothetical protein
MKRKIECQQPAHSTAYDHRRSFPIVEWNRRHLRRALSAANLSTADVRTSPARRESQASRASAAIVTDYNRGKTGWGIAWNDVGGRRDNGVELQQGCVRMRQSQSCTGP